MEEFGGIYEDEAASPVKNNTPYNRVSLREFNNDEKGIEWDVRNHTESEVLNGEAEEVISYSTNGHEVSDFVVEYGDNTLVIRRDYHDNSGYDAFVNSFERGLASLEADADLKFEGTIEEIAPDDGYIKISHSIH